MKRFFAAALAILLVNVGSILTTYFLSKGISISQVLAGLLGLLVLWPAVDSYQGLFLSKFHKEDKK